MILTVRKLVHLMLAASILMLGTQTAHASTRPAAASQVTTIAGSGALGIQDGPADKATFIFPTSVAVARDGTVYVSDRDAQRIRIITKGGMVRTVAGGGPIIPPGLIVQGGYADGPASQARFNDPEGIAFGPDGALYVADGGNQCIRRLANGVVTTFAGKPGSSRPVDGPLADARFVHPEGIAFDESGNMYVADFGGFVRKITPAGIVSSLITTNADARYTHGVAVTRGPNPTLLAASSHNLLTYRLSDGAFEGFLPRRVEEGNIPFGSPEDVVALDDRQFLYSDVFANNVVYARLAAPPFQGKLFSRIIAGGAFASPMENAGYRDGSRADSRFYDPMGIAVANNDLIVADGGNRRVRRIELPHTRVPEAGFGTGSVDDKHYEVALVGASWTFWSSMGDDSICAAIERTLDASHRFNKPVRCHTVEIDAGQSNAIEDYIKNVLPYERMDLVIMDAESWSYNLPDYVVPDTKLTWAQTFRQHMQQLLDVLQPLKTQLALVWVYPTRDTSDSEWIVEDGSIPRPQPEQNFLRISTQMEAVLKGMPILQYDAYHDILNYEKSFGALPLYGGVDQHPNPRGNAFLGDHFAEGLLKAGLVQPR